jgi:hypothetical protein
MRSFVCLMVLSLVGLPVLASDLPEFSVKDPSGAVHTQKELLERGAVVLITIPNAKHGDFQTVWKNHLKKQITDGGPRLVMVEDMSQSNVRDKAEKSMKEKFKPGQETLLLVDDDGSLRKALNAPADETVVQVYDKNGKLLQQVTSPSTADEIVDAAKALGKLIKSLGGEK